MPLYRLLGGLRDRAPAYGSDGGWLNMSVEEIVAAGCEYLDQGMHGVKLKVGHDDPAVDIERVAGVRDALGPDTWIAVDANQKWDLPRATRAGRAFEELGCAWFEEPMLCDDVIGHARLSRRLDIPIALGETLGSPLSMVVWNKDWENWKTAMSALPPCMSSAWPSTRQSTPAVGRPTVRMIECGSKPRTIDSKQKWPC